MGSLLEGIETAPPKASAKRGPEAAKTIKLAIAIGGLLIGGVLIAWNVGLFDFGEKVANSPQAGAASSSDDTKRASVTRPSPRPAAASQNDSAVVPPIKSGPHTFPAR